MPKTGEVYRPEGKDKHSGWVGRYTYTIQGSDIEVAIFDDMLEITSPGPFPDTLALTRLEQARRKSGAEFWRPFSRRFQELLKLDQPIVEKI